MTQILTSTTEAPVFEINASRQFTAWLAEQFLSLVFTTYQAGKVFFIGLNPATGRLSIFQRTFERCMGLYAQDSTLYMSSLYQLWRLENSLQPGEIYNGYDAIYVPQMSYITGDLDIHDVAVGNSPQKTDNQQPVFINTLFSCLAKSLRKIKLLAVWF